MQTQYKPLHYNSLSPYLIVDDAQKLIDQLKAIFAATELRRYEHENGSIAHAELKIDDSILMLSNSTGNYPARETVLHLYVPDVLATFARAIANGCEAIGTPVNKAGDPDVRGSFYDCARNYWSIGMQTS